MSCTRSMWAFLAAAAEAAAWEAACEAMATALSARSRTMMRFSRLIFLFLLLAIWPRMAAEKCALLLNSCNAPHAHRQCIPRKLRCKNCEHLEGLSGLSCNFLETCVRQCFHGKPANYDGPGLAAPRPFQKDSARSMSKGNSNSCQSEASDHPLVPSTSSWLYRDKPKLRMRASMQCQILKTGCTASTLSDHDQTSPHRCPPKRGRVSG